MKKTLLVLLSATLGFYSCGQKDQSTKAKVSNDKKMEGKILLDESRINTSEFKNNNFFHTEANYTDSEGKGIIIQNGFPRGGGLLYTSDYNLPYGHAVFWSRVINKMDTPLEISINFPADSIIISQWSGAHFKLLAPQDTMALDDVSKFSYGLEDAKSFVESNFNKSSQVKRIIEPKEDTTFYVILLSYTTSSDQVISRTGLFLKEQELFYKLTVDSLTSKIIPCGRIVLKNGNSN